MNEFSFCALQIDHLLEYAMMEKIYILPVKHSLVQCVYYKKLLEQIPAPLVLRTLCKIKMQRATNAILQFYCFIALKRCVCRQSTFLMCWRWVEVKHRLYINQFFWQKDNCSSDNWSFDNWTPGLLDNWSFGQLVF